MTSVPETGERPFGVYIHVPFCAVRCGYCDFNTYAPGETDASPGAYVDAAHQEIRRARRHLVDDQRPISTVFFGGGTPTMLDSSALSGMLGVLSQEWEFADDVEITTEANPDSVTPTELERLAEAGFTRVSLGMQSAVPHVLRMLDRTHTPESVPAAVIAAKDAGVHVSVDLIYGTPGETLDDWHRTLEAALALETDHVSAYALVIESGTKMGRQLARGDIPPVDLDVQADMYLAADEAFTSAGFAWYEISNWARVNARSRHNMGYWTGADWWGIGPGAHSYLRHDPHEARRWWNVKNPRAYAERLAAGDSPEAGHELLTEADLALEKVMLGIRLVDGVSAETLDRGRAEILVARGLFDAGAWGHGRAVLTLQGRLLADAVVRDLT